MAARSVVQNTAKRHTKFETLSSCYGDFPFLSVRRPQANKLVEKPLCHRRVGGVLFQHHFATCFVEVLTFFEIKISGDVTPCLLINAVWLNIREERNLHQHCCDNLGCRKVHFFVYGKPRFTLRATLNYKSRLFTSWRRIWSWHTHTHTSAKAHFSLLRRFRATVGRTPFAAIPIDGVQVSARSSTVCCS